jgi:hypothetical protein
MKPTQKQCIVAALIAQGYTLTESFTHADQYSKDGYDKNVYVGVSGSLKYGPKVSYAHVINGLKKSILIADGKRILQSQYAESLIDKDKTHGDI